MPKDARGNFHGNIGRAMAADKNAMPAPKVKARSAAPVDGMNLTSDESDPIREHLSAMANESGGKHMLVSHDGMNISSHQVDEDGEVEGPHDFKNLEELKQHMDRFLDEEGAEGGPDAGMSGGEEDSY